MRKEKLRPQMLALTITDVHLVRPICNVFITDLCGLHALDNGTRWSLRLMTNVWHLESYPEFRRRNSFIDLTRWSCSTKDFSNSHATRWSFVQQNLNLRLIECAWLPWFQPNHMPNATNVKIEIKNRRLEINLRFYGDFLTLQRRFKA